MLSNKKKRKEYDQYGHIDENDEEFSDFLNNLDFMELTSMLFGDLLFSGGMGEKKGKSKVFRRLIVSRKPDGKKGNLGQAPNMLMSFLAV